jgi:thiol:disulfide interchange protein
VKEQPRASNISLFARVFYVTINPKFARYNKTKRISSMMNRIFSFLLLFSLYIGFVAPSYGQQPLQPEVSVLKKTPEWKITVDKKEVKIGEEMEITFTSEIEKNWYMYSNDFDPNLGPIAASITFAKHPSYKLIGNLKPVGSKKHFEEVWGGDVSIFTGKAVFKQKVKILAKEPVIKGTMEFQECNTVSGVCMPPFDPDFEVKGITVVGVGQTIETDDAKIVVDTLISPEDKITPTEQSQLKADLSIPASAEVAGGKETSLIGFLLFAVIGGLVAVVTPCVFPMLPMTVTFFTKKSDTRAKAITRAITFGLSIIGIYTSLGLVFALFGLGPDFGNWLSTHWVPNVLFFVIFMVFAASFLGMFEITLPHGFVNRIDSKSSMTSFLGVFFMAFTLALVSFSCTGPIVGSLLIEAVGGQFTKPLLGMAAFGFGLALPFTLFATFPNMMQSLPKSGGWLNSVKVVLGFLELALAFKFLSIPDQTYHWGLLDREVYIAIWIVIFFLLGLYLLGKLKFSHDSDIPYLSVPRLGLAIITFSFVLYLVPGMFGAPLKALSGYLPPQATLDFDLNNQKGTTQKHANNASNLGEIKYKDLFHLPHNLEGFFDYKQALAYSKKVNKPIFIDFTGHGCVNCREMEANVWSDPQVLKRLQEDYVIVAIYVDDKTELPENEWYTSGYDSKVKKTIGKQNADLQISKYAAAAQPYYVLIDADESQLVSPKAYDLEIQNFVDFLDAGKKAFYEKHPKTVQ